MDMNIGKLQGEGGEGQEVCVLQSIRKELAMTRLLNNYLLANWPPATTNPMAPTISEKGEPSERGSQLWKIVICLIY